MGAPDIANEIGSDSLVEQGGLSFLNIVDSISLEGFEIQRMGNKNFG
jgi:hypothetical protein